MATPMKEKKKRKANFSSAETTLVDLVEENLAALRGKFPVQLRTSRSKKNCEDITTQVNSLGYEKLTAVEV